MPEPYRYADGIQVAAVGGMDRIKKRDRNADRRPVLRDASDSGRTGADDRLRECRQPAAGARFRPPPGAGHPRSRSARAAAAWSSNLLVETALLSLAGVAFGLMLREAMASAVEEFKLPLPIPIRLHLTLDWRVTLYAILLAAFATTACGLLPAWRSVRQSHRAEPPPRRPHAAATRAGGRTVGTFADRADGGLPVPAESVAIERHQPRLRCPPHHLRRCEPAAASISRMSPGRGSTSPQALRELTALPGIESAAAARVVPFTAGTRFMTELKTAGYRQDRARTSTIGMRSRRTISGRMGIPIDRGQYFPSQTPMPPRIP